MFAPVGHWVCPAGVFFALRCRLTGQKREADSQLSAPSEEKKWIKHRKRRPSDKGQHQPQQAVRIAKSYARTHGAPPRRRRLTTWMAALLGGGVIGLLWLVLALV